MSAVTWIKQVQILMLTLGVCTSSVVQAGVNQWTQKGLGGFFTELLIDPQTPTIFYALTDSSNSLSKSIDGGESWVPLTPPNTTISHLALDPRNPTTLYASYVGSPTTATDVSTGVLKSSDGGGSWVSVLAFPYSTGACQFGPLAVAPTTPATIYASCFDGSNAGSSVMFKSADGGATWTPLDFPPNGGIHIVAIDPKTPTTIYAATYKNEIFKSIDGGIHWTIPGTLPPPSSPSSYDFVSINVLVLDPTTPSTLYAGTNYGLFKSVDGGVNWLATGLPIGFVAVVLDPVHSTTLYAACQGFYTSCPVPPPPYSELSRYEVFGVLQSTDGGQSWTSINNGLDKDNGIGVSALAIDPLSGSTLYANIFGLRLGGLDPNRVPLGVFAYQVVGPQEPHILANTESPEEGQLVSGIGLVRGWAFPTPVDDSLVQPALFVDGRLVSTLPCCSERSDVQAAFPQFPPDQAANSGWGGVFNWGALNSGLHSVQVGFANFFDMFGFPQPPTVSLFLSASHTIRVVKPGDFEFLDRFDLSPAHASIVGDELAMTGVIVGDKATQQQKQINARFRWFTSAQSLGMVQAETTSTLASSRSVFSRLVAAVAGLWQGSPTLVSSAQAAPGITSYFESPEEGQVVAGLGIIRGWGSSVHSVRFAVDGVSIGTTSCCSYRDDVGNFLSGNARGFFGYDSGWSLQFNYGDLSPGPHVLTVQQEAPDGETQTLNRSITTLRIGGFTFLDQFDLSNAAARIEGEDIVLSGVQVRDKGSQQTKTVDVRLRWFENSQSLGIVTSTE